MFPQTKGVETFGSRMLWENAEYDNFASTILVWVSFFITWECWVFIKMQISIAILYGELEGLAVGRNIIVMCTYSSHKMFENYLHSAKRKMLFSLTVYHHTDLHIKWNCIAFPQTPQFQYDNQFSSCIDEMTFPHRDCTLRHWYSTLSREPYIDINQWKLKME